MIGRREFIGAGPAALLAARAAPASAFFDQDYVGLRVAAAKKGLLIGAAMDYPEDVKDQGLRASIARNCNIVVPENGFNWTRVQPTANSPLDFTQAQQVYDFAQTCGAAMRCHALVYDQTTPAWARQAVAAMTPIQAERFLVSYIDRVMGAWKGRLLQVEVVNEPGYPDTERYNRPFVFFDKLGYEYIDIAFHAARAADPKPTLYLNASILEQQGPVFDSRRQAMLDLIAQLKSRGVPVQALGLEAHLRTDYPFSQEVFAQFLSDVAAMGLDILITEFDVNDRALPAAIGPRDAEAAALTKAFFDVAFANRRCRGMLAWTWSDRYSWLIGASSNDRHRTDGLPIRAGLVTADYQRKPMWYALAAAIRDAPAR